MTAEEKFNYWKAHAERDLDAAQAMFDTGRWFYVMFCCQQSVEKLVKGLYVLYVDDNVPRIHNIKALVERFEDKLTIETPEMYIKLFKVLTGYYADSRYPDYVSEISDGIGRKEASEILETTKEAFAWLLTLKPQKE